MTDEKKCEKCGMHDSCGKIFKLLDKTEDSRIGLKFLAAFFVPLIIFIFSLIALYSIIFSLTSSEMLSGTLAAACAVLLVLIYAFICKMINKRKG